MKHSKTSSCMSYTKRDDNLLVGGCMKMKHSKTNSCTSYTIIVVLVHLKNKSVITNNLSFHIF